MLDGTLPAQPVAGAAGRDDGMGELMQQFDAALQELQNDPSLDRETRDFLRQQFTQALQGAATGDIPLATVPDRSMWMDAVQALQAGGAVSEDEVNDLIRQINQALQPLQRRESQLAIEFSRRLQSEGEEKALAWFRKESGKTPDGATTERVSAPPPSADVSPLLRGDVVNSRSRRLRGPPQK